MVQKLKSAMDARRDPKFDIRVRTDAAWPLGIQAAIDRLCADALLTAADIELVAKSTSKPLLVNMGLGVRSRPTTPLIHPKKLQRTCVAAVSYPRMLSTSALRGMMNTVDVFKDMLDGDQEVDRDYLQVSFHGLNALMGMNALDDLKSKYTVSIDP